MHFLYLPKLNAVVDSKYHTWARVQGRYNPYYCVSPSAALMWTFGANRNCRHRLNTIIDSDRVLVMNAGEVAEFDAPEKLLEKKESIFFSLASDAGLVGADGGK